MTYRILSIDGGGIRGVLSITILKRLQEKFPDFLSKIDLFAGTSTGGILALALASGKTPEQALKLYVEKGKDVFMDTPFDDIKDAFGLAGAEYSNAGLRTALVDEFGNDMRLQDLKSRVLISSFDLDNESVNAEIPQTWKPKFFHNFPGEDNDGDQSVVDVALRTAAAPTFFPIYQGYIDGGVVANNPSMCALAQAVDKKTGKQRLSRVVLLSISTGGYPKYLPEMDGDWGLLKWGKNLIDIMMEGSVEVAHYQCSRILGNRYHRIAPRLSRPIGLGNIDEIPALQKAGEDYKLDVAIKFIEKHFSD
jgi:patatin-like phospholipase/acyl hydrolase